MKTLSALSLLLLVITMALYEANTQITAGTFRTYLLTVSNNQTTRSTDIYLVSAKGTQEMLRIENAQLSPACGEHYFRCPRLLVLKESLSNITDKYTIAIPLENGLNVLELEFQGDELVSHGNHTSELSNCHPIVPFSILESYYTVCIGTDSNLLSVYRVSFTGQKRLVKLMDHYFLTRDLSEFSAFVHVSLTTAPADQWIYFTIANSVRGLNPIENHLEDIDYLDYCSVSDTLVYVGDQILLIYCRVATFPGAMYCPDGSVLYFDIEDQHWINQTDCKLHYRCPNPDVRIVVNPNASELNITYQLENRREEYSLQGTHFDSGVCLGAGNHSFFAYVDEELGVNIVDTSPHNQSTLDYMPVSSKGCLESGCAPLAVIDDTYLIVNEQGHSVFVVECREECTTIIQEDIPAEISAIMHLISTDSPTDSPTDPNVTTPPIDSEPNTESSNDNIAIPVGVSVGVVVLATLSIAVIIAVGIKYRWFRRKRDDPPEDGEQDVYPMNGREDGNVTTTNEDLAVNGQDSTPLLQRSAPSNTEAESNIHRPLTKSRCTESNPSLLSADGTTVLRPSKKRENKSEERPSPRLRRDIPLLETAEEETRHHHEQNPRGPSQATIPEAFIPVSESCIDSPAEPSTPESPHATPLAVITQPHSEQLRVESRESLVASKRLPTVGPHDTPDYPEERKNYFLGRSNLNQSHNPPPPANDQDSAEADSGSDIYHRR